MLFGDRELYYLLADARSRLLRGLFKVQADFDDSIARSAENDRAYARLIASDRQGAWAEALRCARRRAPHRRGRAAGRRPREAVDRDRPHRRHRARGRLLVGQGQAQGDDARRTWRAPSRSRSSAPTGCATARRRRSTRGIVLVDTEGAQVGQINGLSVLQLGSFAFGRPSRITARVRMGAGRVTDIEREVKLGGPLHSKGVMILWGFLAGRYALDVPLALAATLVFEQSYGGVDGDSASSAELSRCCRRWPSSRSSKSLAVTGSVNQWGEVQAIGGVNEKIEGFFDVCRARGLNEQQGVLIPQVQRAAPDAARGRGGGGAARPVRHLSGRHHRRGHRDPDRRQGGRARRRGPLSRRHHQPAGGGQAAARSPSAPAASPRARATPATTRGTRNDRARRRRPARIAAAWSCSWARRTRAPSRWRRPCASPAPSSRRSRACSSRTSSCSTAPPTASCARCRSRAPAPR